MSLQEELYEKIRQCKISGDGVYRVALSEQEREALLTLLEVAE